MLAAIVLGLAATSADASDIDQKFSSIAAKCGVKRQQLRLSRTGALQFIGTRKTTYAQANCVFIEAKKRNLQAPVALIGEGR